MTDPYTHHRLKMQEYHARLELSRRGLPAPIENLDRQWDTIPHIAEDPDPRHWRFLGSLPLFAKDMIPNSTHAAFVDGSLRVYRRIEK